MSDVTIQAGDGGSFSAYLATPAGGKGAAIVVIQEIFGVNANMRALCDGFAAKGYFAICPDLFWRQEPGVQITDQSEAEWKKAFELYQGFNETKGIEDLAATLAFIRQYPGVTGKVGTVGFCLGGKLAYLTATRTDADASVSYYGVGIEKDLGEASAIVKPLLMHIAGSDGFVPAEAQQKIRDTLANNALVEIHTYQGRDHAFTRIGGAHYHDEDAKRAHARTDAFFAKNLA
ncbi:dienelactone hydrolase family protein [Niveispirillum irakense]|uniref:dienelactone hydrolase family protein n=1 Tax=Niveispirillum irakense TaxID=34011 RepID=UPI0004080877|nr:dienelactone hydrolase family protein [Niveispirillum irakense]